MNVICVPIGDGGGCWGGSRRREGAAHDSQLVFIRADAELGVDARTSFRLAEIRGDAQKFRVPLGGAVDVVGGQNHRGESSQDSHRIPFR